MTQKEKNVMAREVSDWYEHRQNPEGEPPAVTGRHAECLPLIERIGKNITAGTRRESYHAAQEDAAARRRVILEILTESRGMTAREVAGELHRRGITPTDERNYAAPRLTELAEAGKVIVTGKKLCVHTGRNVAVWAVKE